MCKKDFLERFKHTNNLAYKWIFVICSLIVIWAGYYFANKTINSSFEVIHDDGSYAFQVDSITLSDNAIILDGFKYKYAAI